MTSSCKSRSAGLRPGANVLIFQTRRIGDRRSILQQVSFEWFVYFMVYLRNSHSNSVRMTLRIRQVTIGK
jgi:hypothetical protein